MFANGMAHRLAQHGFNIPPDIYKESAREVFQLLTCPDVAAQKQDKELQLVFRHDCMALACISSTCKLCKHNPSRRCAVNFDKKYLVNDVLKAKCQAVIRVEVVDPETNSPLDASELPSREMLLQMAILDGNSYDNKYEAGLEAEYESCLLFTNNKGSPTLVGTGVANDSQGFTCVPLTGSRIVLPDLRVTDSSEAMLSGRKPPLRLMMRAVYADTLQPVPNIRHAISEGFVVATRRTRTAGKVEIPSVDDHVSKLEHMGRETVKKLADLREAAVQAGIDDLEVTGATGRLLCVETVGAFQQLALHAEQDVHLQKRLQQVLKLSREKWEEARDHALKAVVIDNRMRVWWAPQTNPMSPRQGLVVPCSKGTADLEHPVALIDEHGKAVFAGDWSPAQADLVRRLQPMALAHWWQPKHLNWDLLEWDSEIYKTKGQLVRAAVADMEDSAGNVNIGQQFGKLDGSGAGPSSTSGMPPNGASMHDIAPNGSGMPPRTSRNTVDNPHLPMAASAAQALASRHMGPGLHTVFDDGRGSKHPGLQGASAHGQATPNNAGAGSLRHLPGGLPSVSPDQGALQEMRSSGGFDVFPHMGGAQDAAGTRRMLSGMSLDNFGNDALRNMTMSQNLSGLDTMQSIEQALPPQDEAGVR